jgi:hypothetical protein
MTGGAGQLTIHTPAETPGRITVGGGAARVTLDGNHHTGVPGGTVFEPPAWAGARDRYDIDMAAAVSTLTVDRPS